MGGCEGARVDNGRLSVQYGRMPVLVGSRRARSPVRAEGFHGITIDIQPLLTRERKMSLTGKRKVSREDMKKAENDEKESLLEHDSDLDEDMIFNRPSTSTANPRVDGKMDNVRVQIQDVTDIMRENVHKVMERGDKLEDLQEASERLTMAGNEFRDAARKAQRKAWLQNLRSRIIVVTITVTIVVFIVVLDIMVLYLVLR